MAKSSADKLAQALRANLKRRKQTKAREVKERPAEPAAMPEQKHSKTGH